MSVVLVGTDVSPPPTGTEVFAAKQVDGVAVTVTVVAVAAPTPHPGGVGKPLSVQPGDEGLTLN